MDHAKKGADALIASNFPEAIENYTLAIKSSPTSPDYFIKRSTAYQRSSPPNFTSALNDAENAVVFAQKRAKRELIIQAQLRRAIALFGLERYGDAGFVFDVVKRMDPKEKTLSIWENKIKTKLAALKAGDEKADVTVKETPEVHSSDVSQEKIHLTQTSTTAAANNSNDNSTAVPTPAPAPVAQTPANKIRHDWYQNTENVYFTLLAKGVPKGKAVIDIQERSLSISFPLITESTYDLSLEPLFAAVDPSKSTSSILGTKVEVVLKKAQPGVKWHSLESKEPISTSETSTSDDKPSVPSHIVNPPASAPSYPTSSRSGPKNWDKLADDLTAKKTKPAAKSDDTSATSEDKTKKPNEDDDDYDYEREDGDEVNGFFKKLYAGASPEVRRAMMKSFTESNGTALSTNWDEVGKGKVETQPPEGMEARPWGK